MTLWARARRIPLVIVSLVVLGLLLRLGRGHVLVIPTVVGGGAASVLWSTFLPLLWAVVLCAAFESVGSPVEQRPGRHVVRLDCSLFLIGTLAFAATSALMDRTSAWVLVVAHAMFLGGLATAATAIRGAGGGAMAVTVAVLLTSSYSPHISGAEYARFLQPDGNISFAVFLGVLLTVLAVLALTGRALEGPAGPTRKAGRGIQRTP